MKRLLSSLILLILLSGSLAAQTADADEATINNWLRAANDHAFEFAFSEADSLAQKALNESKTINYIAGEAKSFRCLGFIAELQENWESSFRQYMKALALYESLQDSFQIASVCKDISIMKNEDGDYRGQVQFAQRAVRIFERLQNKPEAGNAYIDLANGYRNQRNYYLSKSHYKTAIALLSEVKDTLGRAIAHYGLGNLYYKTDLIDSALLHVRQALDIFEKEGETPRMAMAYNSLGGIFLADKELKKAKAHFLKSADLAEDPGILFDANLNLTELAINTGNYQEAKRHYAVARQLMEGRGNQLDEIYLAKAEARIEEMQQRRKKNITQVFFLFLFIASIMVFYSLRQKQKQKQATHEFTLRQSKLRYEKEIANLFSEIKSAANLARLKGETAERQKISKAIHDKIGSQLAATRWLQESVIEDFKNGKLSLETMEDILKMLSEAYHNSRNIERLLNQDRVDWLQEIADFYQRISERQKLKVKFFTQGIESGLPNQIGYITNQIVFTLTANVLLHANANQLRCQINQQEKELIIRIEDDGDGFDPSTASKGSGLKNVEERVRELKGKWHIDSQKGKGAVITISIPAFSSKSTAYV